MLKVSVYNGRKDSRMKGSFKSTRSAGRGTKVKGSNTNPKPHSAYRGAGARKATSIKKTGASSSKGLHGGRRKPV